VKGDMELALETKVREFLLGLSLDDFDTQVEDGILNGTIDAGQVRLIEDELIDEFLFGSLSPEEQKAFTTHFLCSEDRKQRLVLARQLIHYAKNHPSATPSTYLAKPRPRFWWQHLFWRWTAVTAMACSVLLAVLLGIQLARSIRETQAATDAQNEADRLRAALAQSRSHSLESVPSLELSPERVRGFDAVPGPVLHLSSRSEFVWIRLQLPAPPEGSFREELIGEAGKSLWKQELPAANKESSIRSDLAIPASLFSPGDYLIRLEEASPTGTFEETATYAFRVAAN